jgi:hypothetical protein
LSEAANSCPKCGWQVTPDKVAEIEDKEGTVDYRLRIAGAGGVVVLFLLIFSLIAPNHSASDNEKARERQAINIVQQFYAPGNYLQVSLAGRNWVDEGVWTATPWPFADDGMKKAGMTENWTVIYDITVMSGLEEKRIEAEWVVELNTKAHSASNATAKTLFIGF